METMINKTHIIDEAENVEGRICKLLCRDISISEIVKFIQTEENTIFYFNEELSERKEGDKDIYYAWADTGYCYKGEAVFISMIHYSGEFCGHFVGTAAFLVNGLIERNAYSAVKYRQNLQKFHKKYKTKAAQRQGEHLPAVSEERKSTEAESGTIMKELLNKAGFKIEEKEEIGDNETTVAERKEIGDNETAVAERDEPAGIADVTEKIFANLLYSNWNSIRGLDRYIKIIGRRIAQLIAQNKEEYFVKNKIGSVIINSGLINIFGKDYFILYRFHEKSKTYIPYRVMEGKKDYIQNEFTKEQASAELKPIQFMNKCQIIFEPSIDEFDINQECLTHIIEERRHRFPENLQEEPENKIAGQIMTSLERGLQIQMRDRSYAKMSYSGKDGKLSWLLPLHVNVDFTKEPELVMVIRKEGEFYEVKTILPYDNDLKDRITAVSLYSRLW